MSNKTDHIHSDCVSFDFNRSGGNLKNVVFTSKFGSDIRPLHTAPWVTEPETLPDSVALVERQLAGDFFCAPFGGGDGLPIHGWTANGTWLSEGISRGEDGAHTNLYRLKETVNDAAVSKALTVRPGHPFLYQCHRFEGGAGHLPVGHHAMIRVPGGARLSFSGKQFGITPNSPPETDPARGRSVLKYPQKFARLDRIEDADGKLLDIRHYPFCTDHEELIVLAGKPTTKIGWSAALARDDGFLFFAIKDANKLPETLLWMSNGGRKYAPWLDRHRFVLGIEEVATSGHFNRDFSSTGAVSPHGLVTGLSLDDAPVSEIRYGFGAVAPPPSWTEVIDIRVDRVSVTLADVGGEEMTLPFDGAFFDL